MQFKTATEVWKALSEAEKGAPRAEIIKKRAYRNLILNSGSFVTFSTGDIDEAAESYQQKLSPIRVLQTQRLNIKTAADDGKGTFGGLSERTSPDEDFEKLVGIKDDLKLLPNGTIEYITDLNEVARRSAAREAVEEISEISDFENIYQKLKIQKDGLSFTFDEAVLLPVPITRVKDDNFVINIWGGDIKNPAFAITPYGHLMDLEEEAFDEIVEAGAQKFAEGLEIIDTDPTREALQGREILGVEGVPLFEALKQWGKDNADGTRDLSSDYRYPHEWMAVWYKAQVVLGLNQVAGGDLGARQVGMVNLIKEVQQSIIDDAAANAQTPYNINLIGALTQMNGGHLNDISELEGFEEDFGLPHTTFYEMHKAAEGVMRKNGFTPTSPYVSDHAVKSAPVSTLAM